MSKEKTRRRSKEKEKEDEVEFEPLTEEEWLHVLEKAREVSEIGQDVDEESVVLVMPVTEEEEKRLEELARKTVKRLSSRFVWIAKRGRYGFMFVIPSEEADIEQWGSEWAGFTIEWCREMLLHIISSRTLVLLDPFNELKPDRHRAVKIILGILVKQELGRWIDEAEGILRVTWKTDEEWAEEIRRWALKTGRTTFTLFKLQEYRKDLTGLPKSELRKIIECLVGRKLARWLDHEQEVVEIKV
ncbi:MAG: hypothetical protein ACFFDP_06825 [Promethearchaeota archaeon]